MSDTQPVAPDTDDLDAFTDLFNGKAPEAVAAEVPDQELEAQEVSEDEPEADPVTDDIDDEADPLADEDQDEAPEAVKPPKQKSRLQERIDALVEKARIAEERERDAIRRIEELEAKGKEPEKPKQVKETIDPDAPQPDDKLDNGEDKYPLGEFDPTYIRDVTRFTLRKEAEALKEEQRKEREAAELAQAREELAREWDVKLERARKVYDDIDEKNAVLEQTFRGLEPQYGEYLVTTIMSLDYGPEILRHFADNIKEAEAVITSGPAKAAIALGRLDARFALHDEENKEQQKLKVSKAPQPPERVNKGTSVSKVVSPDTDDLSAFEQAFFRKR